MPLPTVCFFHSGLVNIHTADQAMWLSVKVGLACLLAQLIPRQVGLMLHVNRHLHHLTSMAITTQ
jgi:hypothetical protein